MIKQDYERRNIENFLKKSGLAILTPTLNFARNREYSRVWTADLLTQAGDARVEIAVYSFKENPGLIVEYEEEKAVLHSFASQENRWYHAPEIVLEGHTEEFGILVLASADDADTIRRYLDHVRSEGSPKDHAKSSGIHCNLVYHPQFDRLFGGDFAREVDCRIIKSCFMSLKRAMSLAEALTELSDVYPEVDPKYVGKTEILFPLVLAVMEIQSYPVSVEGEIRQVPIDELFTIESLAAAPPEYHHLAQMHTLIAGLQTIQDVTLDNSEALLVFAHKVFRIINCGHRRLSATFSRGTGCCIRPEFLTPDGELLDMYFFTRSGGELMPEELHRGQFIDLVNAFDVFWQISSSSVTLLVEMFDVALTEYANPDDVLPDLSELASRAAQTLANLPHGASSSQNILSVLANSVLTAYPLLS